MDRREGAYEEMRIEIKKLTEEKNRLKNDICQQAEQMGGEKGKLHEVNNRLNDIGQQAEQMKREKEKLTKENNRLKNDILQQAELMQAVVFHLNLGKIHIYGELK